MRFFKSFWYIFKIWYVFYTYIAFEFGPATFQVLYSHVWFSANIGLCSYWPIGHWPQNSLETDCTLAKPEAKAYVLLLYQRYNPWGAKRQGGSVARRKTTELATTWNQEQLFHVTQSSSETCKLGCLSRRRKDLSTSFHFTLTKVHFTGHSLPHTSGCMLNMMPVQQLTPPRLWGKPRAASKSCTAGTGSRTLLGCAHMKLVAIAAGENKWPMTLETAVSWGCEVVDNKCLMHLKKWKNNKWLRVPTGALSHIKLHLGSALLKDTRCVDRVMTCLDLHMVHLVFKSYVVQLLPTNQALLWVFPKVKFCKKGI